MCRHRLVCPANDEAWYPQHHCHPRLAGTPGAMCVDTRRQGSTVRKGGGHAAVGKRRKVPVVTTTARKMLSHVDVIDMFSINLGKRTKFRQLHVRDSSSS